MNNKTVAFLFPGQGSQYRGMGKDLYDAHRIVRDTYDEASDTLGYDMARLSFEDPDNRIGLTRYTQTALLTHSAACLRVFNQQTGETVIPDIAAGHSLGEYSALFCARSLNFSQALALVQKRGELMGEFGRGEMEALMTELETAAALAQKHYCGIAALNLPNQVVVGGGPADLDRLSEEFSANSGKRGTRLKTEGAFHTYYMVEAAQRFRRPLAESELAVPGIRVMSNFTGTPHKQDVESIRSGLFLQLFNPVLWYQNLTAIRESGISVLVEFGGGIGSGTVAAEKRPNLEGIVKRAFRGSDYAPSYLSVINLESLDRTVEFFTTG